MKNNNSQKGSETQGVTDLTLDQVKTWLKNDLQRAIGCLNAIYSDPDLMESVAIFMLGRLQNSQAKEEFKN